MITRRHFVVCTAIQTQTGSTTTPPISAPHRSKFIGNEDPTKHGAHHVPISFLGVELQRKAPRIAFRIAGTFFSTHRRDIQHIDRIQ